MREMAMFLDNFNAVDCARAARRVAAVLVAVGLSVLAGPAAAQEKFYRLQLKQNNKFIDATRCSDAVALSPRSAYDGGSCQLWSFIAQGGGWYRIQNKKTGKFLDALRCSGTVALQSRSEFNGGACQLWKVVEQPQGFVRLQLRNGLYLDAAKCSDRLVATGLSDWDGGACQLWRVVPEWVKDEPPAPPPPPPAPGVSAEEQSRCRDYAATAVKQAKDALATQKCARMASTQPGGRWGTHTDPHYQWCLAAPRNARTSEGRARTELLRNCREYVRMEDPILEGN